MGLSDSSWATPWMELHLRPHPLWSVPHIPEPRICRLRATGQGREAGRGFTCHPKQGPVSIPPHLLGPLFLLGGKRVGGSPLFMEPPPAASASGTARCSSTSRSCSHTPGCSLTFPLPLSALPPGWAGRLPGRTEHSCCGFNTLWSALTLSQPHAGCQKYCHGLSMAGNRRPLSCFITPPPTGVGEKWKEKDEKFIGRDKDSLTEQHTKWTVATIILIRRIYKINYRMHRVFLTAWCPVLSGAMVNFFPPPASSPPWNPAWWHRVLNTPGYFGQFGSAGLAVSPPDLWKLTMSWLNPGLWSIFKFQIYTNRYNVLEFSVHL